MIFNWITKIDNSTMVVIVYSRVYYFTTVKSSVAMFLTTIYQTVVIYCGRPIYILNKNFHETLAKKKMDYKRQNAVPEPPLFRTSVVFIHWSKRNKEYQNMKHEQHRSLFYVSETGMEFNEN